MDISDPLRSLELEDGEDLFKAEFNGGVGRIKITAGDGGQEKADTPKPVAEVRNETRFNLVQNLV
jgi:hypothetical protein